MTAKRLTRILHPSPHVIGLTLGTLMLAFSLTPSLLPRPTTIQGMLSGVSFAAGYFFGSLLMFGWRLFELPSSEGRCTRAVRVLAAAACAGVAVAFLWQSTYWQNDVRAVMGLEPTPTTRPLSIGLIAGGVFLTLLLVARLFLLLRTLIATRLQSLLSRRAAKAGGVLLAAALFWAILNGVLIRGLLSAVDYNFRLLDELILDDLPKPTDPNQTGSDASLVKWEQLGRMGRAFVAGGPTRQALSEFFQTQTPAPLRVYVGLNSADSPQARARLALDELIRVGGFERSVLVLVTPTGTGWVDPASQDVVEYLHRGDIATVAAQYSYLNSPLSLLTEPQQGRAMARAMFKAVYEHWRSLPRQSRPRLYLSGLSLGALNSDASFDFFDIIDDPFDGALWSGPPFQHRTWRQCTLDRDPGSPVWLPVFRSGGVVRFAARGTPPAGDAPWGGFRICFLQHASDPIVFFDYSIAWRVPQWMREPRGPDVSRNLRWFPVVTMLQTAADMVVGTAPPGFGHVYAADDYITAWYALTEPDGWTDDQLERLRRQFREKSSGSTAR